MSDWAQPYVDAGWEFDDRDQTVRSTGDWRASLSVVIDATGRWHVRLAMFDAAGEHLREYGFKKFHALAADPDAYGDFTRTLIGDAAVLTKKSRASLVKQLAAQVNAAGGTMVWFKAPGKRVTL